MVLLSVLTLSILGYACGDEPNMELVMQEDGLADTELLRAFVIFRHGDRTPDEEELEMYPDDAKINKNIFFPYGMKALTNKGKARSYRVGQYIRRRYNCLLSKLYLPDEISIRTTDYARTKMTALAALSALYPPPPAQRWNPALDWQPVPYDTVPYSEDDLLYWYNCPRYRMLRDMVYELPEVKNRLRSYQNLFSYLSEKTGNNITKPEEVFYLDNLFQAMENVKVRTPKWAQDIMPQIKEMTKIEYAIEFFNTELTRIASGVLLTDIINASNAAIAGDTDQPKVRLYSAHENNVAALMAAVKVFQPHQPNYGATFSVELRKNVITGVYGITAVYAKDAGGSEQYLKVRGCGEGLFCDYEIFLKVTHDTVWSQKEFDKQCHGQ